jgi:XRE family transcriptional regulator, regulator of sulfur utilization
MPAKKSPANQALGEAIRTVRKEQGYTQESFALKANIDRSYYGAIERGEFNVTVDTLMAIAAGLEVPAADLFRRASL